VAGNSVSATRSGINIDTVAPFINFTSPASGGSYTLNQQVVVNFSCFDTGSGIATCSGSGGNNTQVVTIRCLREKPHCRGIWLATTMARQLLLSIRRGNSQ
jgi:hypothetical protein